MESRGGIEQFTAAPHQQANSGLQKEWWETMGDLPDLWSSYARLQAELARGHGSDQRTWRIDDRSWGVEAALTGLVAEKSPVGEGLDRTIQSASRKERYRKRLRRIHLVAEGTTGTSVEDALDARDGLRRVAQRVSVEDSALLRSVGEGHKYKEIGANTTRTSGVLRARVLHLRRTLRPHTGLSTATLESGVAV